MDLLPRAVTGSGVPGLTLLVHCICGAVHDLQRRDFRPYILSTRSYFVAATVHGVGNVAVSLFYYEVSLSDTVWYSVTAIEVSLVILGATYGLFGRRFRARYAEQFEQIHAD